MNILEFLIYDFKHRRTTSRSREGVPHGGSTETMGGSVRTEPGTETADLVALENGQGVAEQSEKRT